MAFTNGQFPTGATVALATAPGQRLVAGAAENWDALARAVQARYGWMPYLTDSYRPYAVQERIFRERYRVMWSGSGPFGDVRYWQGVRWVRVTGAAAAVPGTSNHGWGKAVDCSGLGGFGGPRFAQLASLAPAYGFTNTEGRSVGEAWHWVFTGSGLVSNPIGGGGSVTVPNVPGAPAPITPEDDLTPELAARLDQIVAWVDGRINQLAIHVTGAVTPTNTSVGKVATAVADTAKQVSDIHSRVNWATRANGEPFKIAVQGDVDTILAAISGVKSGGGAVDVTALADALSTRLGPAQAKAFADELSNRLKD